MLFFITKTLVTRTILAQVDISKNLNDNLLYEERTRSGAIRCFGVEHVEHVGHHALQLVSMRLVPASSSSSSSKKRAP